MNYKKHYDVLIDRARHRAIEGSTESHHIIPRCLGGSDGKKNRVDLTPEEHYVAHQLLVKIYPDNTGLLIAAMLMSRDNRNGKRSNNKLYGWLRRRASKAQSKARTGIPLSEETKAKISAVLRASPGIRAAADKRRGVPRKPEELAKVSASHKISEAAKAARAVLHAKKVGVPRSPETRAKLSAVQVGKTLSEEHKERIRAAMKGKTKSVEHLAKIAAALTGKPSANRGKQKSEETRRKMSIAATGRKMKPEDIQKRLNSMTPEQRRNLALKAWETKREKTAAK